MSRFKKLIEQTLGKPGATTDPAAAEKESIEKEAPEAGADAGGGDDTVPAADKEAPPAAASNDELTPEEVAAFEAGVTTGSQVATARFKAILASEEAKGREAQALALAGDPSVSEESARAILAAGAKTQPTGALSAHMDAEADAPLADEGGSDPKTPGAEIADVLRQIGQIK